MKKSCLLLCGLATLFGCASDEASPSYDEALLATYRAALPSAAQLAAARPQPSTAAALGDPAFYPHASAEIVTAINGSVQQMIAILEAITAVPPTIYNSDTLEFFWGPWPNDDGVGWVGAYIRDVGPDEDFRYHYAFLRGASNDMASLTPVIWGGAKPDANNEAYGVGVTLWDFEANRSFDEANDPDFDATQGDRGRFVTLYGRGPDETQPDNEATYVVAVFRDFVPKDNPGADPADLDYFFGHYVTSAFTADFLDFETGIDIDDPKDAIREDVGIRMVFLDEGPGRAEIDAANGSLAAGATVTGIECWDTSLLRTYLEIASGDATYTEGALTGCGLFQQTLDEMNIPSLQDVDPALMAALDQVAATGLPTE